MQPRFIHLRLHSEFSLVDGIVKIKPLVKRLAELNMPAVAVTDHVNLFSLVKFYKTAIAQGIKPIAGADVLLFNPEDPSVPHRLTLLVNNHRGYVTLTELISQAYQHGQHQGIPMLQRDWLARNHQGLIALSGAMQGDIGKALIAGNTESANKLARYWEELFPQGFYLELQRVGKPDEELYIGAAIELALETGLPVVATNDVRFIHAKEFAAHEVRVCINQSRTLDDPRRPKDYTEQQYLRSAEDMIELFADIPEALANSVEIAKRCSLTLTLGKNFLPDYPVPEGMTLSEVMRHQAEQGLAERLAKHGATGNGTEVENRQVYQDRLHFELNMISQMGFPGYFMIVADFIQWAKNHHIPVGPGRGSGAGSLVAYALKITDLDPIEFELLFERFLNPERISMPDFDIDFCMDRRDEVIDYVAEHYGRDHVAQIITYGSMAAKAVVRDVGRVLGFGYGFVDKLAKLIPFEIGMTLDKALKDSPELKQLYDTDEEVKTLIDMALTLEGTARNAGKHAGGVVIAPTKLTDFTPLYCEQDGSNLVTQFDKSDVEAVGLVKFDFLGLRTLTIIDWALQTINTKQRLLNKELVDISAIPRDDTATYELLKKGDTTAVFQLESRGMKELIKKLKPDCFNDIIALVALFRPGPLESGMVDDYVNVKHKIQKAEYAHPLLESILKPTNGVILYQEQVMQIARELSGYSLGGADILRRCLSGSTEVIDVATGNKVTLQTIANNQSYWLGRELFSLDLITQKIVTKPITAIYDNGVRAVWEITTKTNRKIRATDNHLFYTLLGWQPLSEFKLGDSIALTQKLPISHSSDISDAQIKITAYLIGDGYLSNKERVSSYFCNSDEALINDFNDCCFALFNRKLSLAYQHHSGRKSVCYARINFNAFNEWIDTHIKRAISKDKEIPLWVYRLSTQQLALFIGTLWSTDGSFDTAVGHTDYTSTSKTLIEQLQHLLLRLGIVALFNIKKITYKGQQHISYRAQITGREDMLKFQQIITPYLSSAKAEKAQLCYQRVKDKLQNQSKYQLPSSVIHLIAQAKQVSGMTWAEIDALMAMPKGTMSGGLNFTNPRHELSRHRVRYFAQAFNNQKLQAIADSEILLDKIVSINYIGEESVFDLTIPDTHNFIANDFITHNCMGKKDSVEMARQRDTFVSGAMLNKVDEPTANYIFDLVDKFSGYGFNKSHSAAYALVAYQTAWLKTHYAAAFMAAVLSSDMDNTDKVVILIDECRAMKLKVLAPTINNSVYRFTVNDKDDIIYGLGALKGAGEAALAELISERESNGLFTGLYDLCHRVDTRKVNRRVLEALIKAGAFDEFGDNRAHHLEELNTALRVAEQHGKMAKAGQNDLFGLVAQSDELIEANSNQYSTVVIPWTSKERLDAEKAILGLYLTGHPIDAYTTELQQFIPKNIALLLSEVERARKGSTVRMAGLAIDIGVRQNKQGKYRGFAILDDNTGRIEISAYREAYDNNQALFNKDNKDSVLIAEGLLAIDDYLNVPLLKLDKLYSFEQARAVFVKAIEISWTITEQTLAGIVLVERLNEILSEFKQGIIPLVIRYTGKTARATIQLADHWRVQPSDDLIKQLRALFGINAVTIRYK